MTEGAEPSVGGLLAQARQAKGMTTAEVADKLKLTARQIEAIEAEEYDKLPAAVFVRGFIRNYARLLGLDADQLLASMGEAQGATTTITAPSEGVTISSSPLKRWMIYLVGGAVLFLLLVALLYEWLSAGETSYVVQPETPATALPAPGPTDTVTPVSPPALAPAAPDAGALPAPGAPTQSPSGDTTGTPVPPALPNAPASAPTPAATPTPAPASMPPTATPPAAPARAPAPQSATPGQPVAMPQPQPQAQPSNPYLSALPARPGPVKPAPQNASAQAVLRFSTDDESWVQVVDGAGKRSSQLIMRGSGAMISGTPPFQVVVGNAAVVTLRYNDQNIDLRPYTGVKVARLTLE